MEDVVDLKMFSKEKEKKEIRRQNESFNDLHSILLGCFSV